MINFSQNQSFNPQFLLNQTGKTKPVNLKYLYEFAAISIEVRKQYLGKLLKRKNSEKQKNVCLLKIIYSHIEEYKMLKWDDNQICRELNLSKGAYYVQKSCLLKGIRELYFGWKEVEKKEFSEKTNFVNENYFLINKAKRINDLGMRKEAKLIFFKLYNELKRKKKKSFDDNVVLFHIYSFLIMYYFMIRNYNKFYIFYKKIIYVSDKILKNNAIKRMPGLKSEVLVNKYTFLGLKINLSPKYEKDYLFTISCFLKALKATNKYTNPNTIIQFYYNLHSLYRDINNYEESAKYIAKGIKFARLHNIKPQKFIFELLDIYNRFLTNSIKINNPCDSNKYTYKINTLFNNTIKFPLDTMWKKVLLLNCSSITQKVNPSSYYYDSQLCSFALLTSGYRNAFRPLYCMKMNYYNYKIFNYVLDKTSSGCDYINILINQEFYIKYKNTLAEILHSFHYVNDILFKSDVYINILISLFYEGIKMDFNKANYVIEQINWLNNSRGDLLQIHKNEFEYIKLGIKIFESSEFEKENIPNKYGQLFYQYCNDLVVKPSLDLYQILSFIVKETGIKEFEVQLVIAYKKINKKFPDFFTPILSEIKSEKKISKPKIEDWGKQFAA